MISGIERVNFDDTKVALDIEHNAGTVAKVLGAVFGKSGLANKEYVGIGLDYLDKGMSESTLLELALFAAGAITNTEVVERLYFNVIGFMPSNAEKASLIGLLDDGMAKGALGTIAAEHTLNADNIDLVGLAYSGIEYL
jgi:hypothetical protein